MMKLRKKELEVASMWIRQGHTTTSVATVVTLCRMLDIEIDKFAAMRSSAQTAIEEFNATHPSRPT